MALETNAQMLERKRIEKQKEEAQNLQLERQTFGLEKLSEMTGYKTELLLILQKTVAKDTTPAEFAYFLTVCKESGLNPINKEIWCYKNSKGDLLVFTGRDGFLAKNKDNKAYRGMKHSAVCEYDQFEIDMVKGEVIEHKISNNRGKPVGAYCYVYIEGMKDTFVFISFEEFDLGQAKWKTAPIMMIDKCAQSMALKEACGMTGIQAEEAFMVKNGKAFSAGQITEHEVITAPDSEVKSQERLLQMIDMVQDKNQLEQLFEECSTIETSEAYDKKLKELTNQ